jgi:hypothetical protein
MPCRSAARTTSVNPRTSRRAEIPITSMAITTTPMNINRRTITTYRKPGAG